DKTADSRCDGGDDARVSRVGGPWPRTGTRTRPRRGRRAALPRRRGRAALSSVLLPPLLPAVLLPAVLHVPAALQHRLRDLGGLSRAVSGVCRAVSVLLRL